jgi:ribosomal protein L16 Arg81 hydroxylase
MNPDRKLSESPAGITFEKIISPLERADFLANYWSKQFVHLVGGASRFESIISWAQLNSILEKQHLDFSRLKLVQNGKAIATDRYLRSFNGGQQLKLGSLVNCLSEGATLILDSVHEYANGVDEVALACEEMLSAPTTVNLYASWRTQNGFDVHWDAQDTLILQVSGRKHWKVYQPTRLHPLRDERVKPAPPTAAPAWDEVLEQGEALYLPRGWWHIAHPLNEPSLHLTVTIVPSTGLTLMAWLCNELAGSSDVRANVPIALSATERGEYLVKLRQLILDRWNDKALNDFTAEWEAALRVPSKIHLPEAPSDCLIPIDESANIRLAVNRHLNLSEAEDGLVAFHANGISWHCPASIGPALVVLDAKTAMSVAALCAKLPGADARGKLISFLTALAMGGVIWVERSSEADTERQ